MSNYPSTLEWQAEPRKKQFGISLVLHIIAILAVVRISLLPPPQLREAQKPHEVLTWVAPEPEVQKIVPPPPRVLAQLRRPVLPPPVAQPEPAKLEAKLEPPKPEPPKPEPPKPEPVKPAVRAPVFETRTAEVAKAPEKKTVQTAGFDEAPAAAPAAAPKREVASAGFGSGSSALPTVKAPVNKVQTGGFGDPNGVPAQNSPTKSGAQIARVGSFDLPNGPGQGNGTGGAHGIRGTVADSGFGNGVATGGVGDGRPGRGSGNGKTVASAGFSDASASSAATAPRAAAAPVKPQTTPVEILAKPRPVYTEEARRSHVEGDVLLEVTFAANGELRVLRVVRGLGHGLDEAAQQAAQRIKFRPATRDGQPTDSTAMVHIIFELAG